MIYTHMHTFKTSVGLAILDEITPDNIPAMMLVGKLPSISTTSKMTLLWEMS